MEWIKQNSGQSIFILVMVTAYIILAINSKKSKQKYIDKLTSRNEMSLCATCGNEYHKDNYYTIRRFNHCSSCFDRMFYQIKVGGGFIAIMMTVAIVFLITFTIMDLMNGDFNNNYAWQVKKLFMFIIFGLFIFQLKREYFELKAAKEEHQRRAAVDLTRDPMTDNQSRENIVCQKCGKMTPANGGFCTKCGARINRPD